MKWFINFDASPSMYERIQTTTTPQGIWFNAIKANADAAIRAALGQRGVTDLCSRIVLDPTPDRSSADIRTDVLMSVLYPEDTLSNESVTGLRWHIDNILHCMVDGTVEPSFDFRVSLIPYNVSDTAPQPA